MNKVEAVNGFFNSFGWKAYDEGTVPTGATMPYITYSLQTDAFNEQVSLTVNLWGRGTSWRAVEEKVADISSAIGRGGKMIGYSGGAVWIKRGSPFAQRVVDEDDDVRRIMILIDAEYCSAD